MIDEENCHTQMGRKLPYSNGKKTAIFKGEENCHSQMGRKLPYSNGKKNAILKWEEKWTGRKLKTSTSGDLKGTLLIKRESDNNCQSSHAKKLCKQQAV